MHPLQPRAVTIEQGIEYSVDEVVTSASSMEHERSDVDCPLTVSAYRTAIDQTARIIEHRARYFRNQIVIVVTISALVLISAVITRSPAALWAWLLLVPACGLFFHADSKVLNEWRSELLTLWIARELDFAALCDAIRANPGLPKETTEGMLATLPAAESLVAEQNLLTPTRQAIGAANLAIHQDKTDALLVKTIASGIGAAALLAAIWMRTWNPLIGLATLLVLPLVRAWTRRWRQTRCKAEVDACRALQGFNESAYAAMRASLR